MSHHKSDSYHGIIQGEKNKESSFENIEKFDGLCRIERMKVKKSLHVILFQLLYKSFEKVIFVVIVVTSYYM